MIKFRAWYMPFGKYGAMQEMVYSRASHILALAKPGDSINFAQQNSKTRRGRVGHGVANILTTAIEQATLMDDLRIRKLTPLECWRLQGFPDWAFTRARESGLSDSQLYKQAGNSVTVPVIKAIAERMKLP